jgi:hypothetical protein
MAHHTLRNLFLDYCRTGCVINVDALRCDHDVSDQLLLMGFREACACGHGDLVSYFLKHIRPMHAYSYGFIDACMHGHVHIIRLLDVYTEKYRGYATGLTAQIVQHGQLHVLQYLELYDVNEAFQAACKYGQLHIATYLYPNLHIILTPDTWHAACATGNVELLKFLIQIETPYDLYGCFKACASGNLDAVTYAFSLNHTDTYGFQMLRKCMHCGAGGNPRVLEFIMERYEFYWEEYAYDAARRDHIDVLKMCYEHPDLKSSIRTPGEWDICIRFAINSSSVRVLDYLLRRALEEDIPLDWHQLYNTSMHNIASTRLILKYNPTLNPMDAFVTALYDGDVEFLTAMNLSPTAAILNKYQHAILETLPSNVLSYCLDLNIPDVAWNLKYVRTQPEHAKLLIEHGIFVTPFLAPQTILDVCNMGVPLKMPSSVDHWVSQRQKREQTIREQTRFYDDIMTIVMGYIPF